MFNRLEYTKRWQEQHSDNSDMDRYPGNRPPRDMNNVPLHRDYGQENNRGFNNQAYQSHEMQEFSGGREMYPALPRPNMQHWRANNAYAYEGNDKRPIQNSYEYSKPQRRDYHDERVHVPGNGNENRRIDRNRDPRTESDVQRPGSQSNGRTGGAETQSGYSVYYGRKLPDTPGGDIVKEKKDQKSKKNHYAEDFGHYYKEPEEEPSWIKSMQTFADKASDNDTESTISLNPDSSSCSKTAYFVVRLLAMFFALWDLCNDWLITSIGPSPFIDETEIVNNGKCSVNTRILEAVFNTSDIGDSVDVCSKTLEVWTALAVFALLGSILTIGQVLNILLEMLNICRRRKTFSIVDRHSEICMVLCVEEIPQAVIMSWVMFVCKCDGTFLDLNTFTLLTLISSTVGITLRFSTAFDGFVARDGCCRQWWRCCCCAEKVPMSPSKHCCCRLDVPCLPCCCTLSCRNCTFSLVPWCVDLVKMFGCFYSWCGETNTKYGIRLVNLFGIFLLWVALAFQIFIYIYS